LLKNNGEKDYNFAKFGKNKNELPDERVKSRDNWIGFIGKALALHLHWGSETSRFVKRRDLSRLEKRG